MKKYDQFKVYAVDANNRAIESIEPVFAPTMAKANRARRDMLRFETKNGAVNVYVVPFNK